MTLYNTLVTRVGLNETLPTENLAQNSGLPLAHLFTPLFLVICHMPVSCDVVLMNMSPDQNYRWALKEVELPYFLRYLRACASSRDPTRGGWSSKLRDFQIGAGGCWEKWGWVLDHSLVLWIVLLCLVRVISIAQNWKIDCFSCQRSRVLITICQFGTVA